MPKMNVEELMEFIRGHFKEIDDSGMSVESVGDKDIRMRMAYHDKHLRPGGTISGPSQMLLCDTVMYLLTIAQIGPVALAVTTNMNINFLRRPSQKDIIAEGKLLKLGKRLAVGEVTLYSEGEEDPVAHATLTYSLPPEKA